MKLLSSLFFMLIPWLAICGVEVTDQSSSSVTVDFTLEGLSEMPATYGGREYTFINFEGAAVSDEAGKPAIPYLETRVAVPPGSRLILQTAVVESEERSGVDIVPQGQIYVRNRLVEPARDESVYGSSLVYPEKLAETGEPYNFRNVNVVLLRINPVRYYPQEHRVEIVRRLRITIRFQGGTQTSALPVSGYEADILSHKIVNYRQSASFRRSVERPFRKVAVNYDFSSGTWFRIPVTTEGIYALTGSFLKSKGVDISGINLSGVHLYNYGGFMLPYSVNASRPSDLNEIAVEVVDENGDGIMNENDRILFYGKGVGGWYYNSASGENRWEYEEYPYDNINYYLFTYNNQPGKRIETTASPQVSGAQVPTRYHEYSHFEEDKYNILSSGLSWYGERFSGLSDKRTLNFTLPSGLADDSTRITFRFKGGSGSLNGDDDPYRYQMKVLVNNQSIFDDLIVYKSSAGSRTMTYPTLFAVHSGSNTADIYMKGNLDGCQVYLDYFEIDAKRPFTAENGQLHFRYKIGNNAAVEYRVGGMPAGTNEVWDLTDFANIKKIAPLSNGASVNFQDVSPVLKGGDYYVFSSSAVKQVGSMESLENHPNLRDPSRKAEFLIITPDEFYESAEFLEQWRETQIPDPLETERVKLSDIFLEFSSSVRDVTGIRDFIKYAYENWSDTLKYVLLFGDGHYDYRGITLKDFPNYIPPFEIDDNSEVYSRETDNYYVGFGMTGNLNDIDPWLPVSRLPVNNQEQIDVYQEKAANYSTAYLLNPEKNGWQTWVTLVADDQNGESGSNNELSWHLPPTETVNKSYIPDKFNRSKIYLHDYDQVPGGLGRWKPKATEDLINQINRGTLLINYFGHGSPDTWAHESLLNRTRDLPKIDNEYRLPLWVAATCTWGKYDDPSHSSMSEELLWLARRGGIAVLSATRPSFVYGNTALAEGFYRNLFHNKSGTIPSRRLGDALYLAMENQGSNNFQKYHLYADPTLHLADPAYMVKVESVEPDTLKALAKVTVRASITDRSGNPMPGFNGYAVLQSFDAEDSLQVVLNNSNPNNILKYTYHGGTVFKGIVTVKNGELTGSFIVPKSIKYKHARTGQLSLYAWSENSGDAIGYVDTLLFYGTEGEVSDHDGPDIQVSFKDAPDFFDGDYVSTQPTLQVEIGDASGINLTGEVGHRVELTIDGGVKKDVTEFFVYNTDSYRDGKLEYTLPALSGGTHQLKISCWDNLNNYSEQEVSFRTSSAAELEIVNAVNYPNPFSTDTYFTFQLNKPVVSGEATVSIYTVTGRKIREVRQPLLGGESFVKIYWDGLDWDGDKLSNGVYLYKIVVDDGDRKVEKTEKLAVLR